jgi:hypothetical protein
MKFELTNPKAWQSVSERNIPMGDKIKVYEKLGGAYRLGEDGGEQVFNDIKELLKHKLNEEDGADHEVGMALNHLDDIIKNATELKSKVGTDETNLAGWIQDHISQAQNYIDQANTGFHKLDGTDESLNEDTYPNVNVTSLVNERVDMDKLEFELKYLKKNNPGKKVEYHFIKSSEYPNGYYFTLNKKIIKNIYKNGVDGVNESKWEVPKGKKEVVLSNAILDFLQDRKLITGINAQKVHKELIAFIKNKIESVNEVKYPTDLKIGSVIFGQAFSRLKGIEGGRYYKIVDMDDTTATLARTDPSGSVSSPTKVRHKLDSIEAGIKSAKRGDRNGIVVIKDSVNEAVSDNEIDKIKFAVQRAGSFMRIGAELKNAGIKYSFSTEPLPIYMIKVGAKYFALVNKKFADKPDFVIGDTAGGMMD